MGDVLEMHGPPQSFIGGPDFVETVAPLEYRDPTAAFNALALTSRPSRLEHWRTGWEDALFVFGLRDCTITNDGATDIRIPVGRREAYIDLAPGETVSIRAVMAPDPAWDGADGLGEITQG